MTLFNNYDRNLKQILLILLSVSFFTSCKISDDKMRVKLNRKIDRSQEKIDKHERKIAGFEQRMARLDNDSPVQADSNGVKYVTTTTSMRGDFQKFIDIQGAVTSKENIMISSNSGGVLMSVPITEGQYVTVGQTLAVVNSDVLQSNIKEVESALQLATAVYDRQKRLWLEQQIGTELQYLEAKNNVENLESRLATLQVQLGDATVRTSISGVVDEVYALKGQMVGPGTVIARVVNLTNVQVEAEVPESFIGSFKKGDKVEVYFQSLGMTRTARIKAIGQVINPGNRTFKVEVDLPNSDRMLKPNLLATLKLKDYESEDVVMVPTRLIQDGAQGKFLYGLEDNKVVKHWLQIGESYAGTSEVLDGLNGDEVLVDLGFREVLEGEEVRVKEGATAENDQNGN